MQIGIRCLGMHRRGLRAAIPASEARPHANAAAKNEPGLVFMVPAARVQGALYNRSHELVESVTVCSTHTRTQL